MGVDIGVKEIIIAKHWLRSLRLLISFLVIVVYL